MRMISATCRCIFNEWDINLSAFLNFNEEHIHRIQELFCQRIFHLNYLSAYRILHVMQRSVFDLNLLYEARNLSHLLYILDCWAIL